MNETQYTKKIREQLEKRGYLVHKNSERFSSGWPDLVAIHEIRTIWIEVKVDDNELTALQEKTLKDIARRGGTAFVMWWDNGKKIEIICKMEHDGQLLSLDDASGSYAAKAYWQKTLRGGTE